MKRKTELLKCLFIYIVVVSIQFLLANILYYREINILYPVTSIHLILTLCYFLSESSFIFIAPLLVFEMLKISGRMIKKVFLSLAILSALIIVSPYFLGFNPMERAMFALPGLIIYRLILYAVNIYLIVIIIKYRSTNKGLRTVLYGSLALIAVSSIETLFCKLMPILHSSDYMLRLSPLIYLLFNLFLIKYFIKKLTEVNNMASFDEITASFKITIREKEIILLLLDGFNNKIISKKLFISEATVKSHILNIYQKLGINSRIQLARIFYNN